jgi:hypothetical protein
MSLMSPWLLLIFIPLGTVIVLLYLLKLKRKERLVSSVMIWRDAIADIQANAPFQKLKKNLLLILQLLALLFLVVAVARPFVRTKGIEENKIVVILDSSASMQSTDVSPSRFERAKSRALAIINQMGPGDKMLIIAASSKARVVSSFSSDKKALAASVKRLRATDAPCDMRAALVLASSLVAGESAKSPRIVIVSDGDFGDMPDLPTKNLRLDYLKIGSRCDNVGIVGLDARRTLSGEQQVFVGIENFSNRQKQFNIEVYLGSELVYIKPESLGPQETKQQILGNLQKARGRLTVKLDVNDDLAADNSGVLYLAGQRRIDVLIVSKGNIFLQNALSLDPRTQLTRSEQCPPDLEKRGFDIVVFDCVKPPQTLPPGGYLLIGTSFKGAPAVENATVANPTIIDSEKRHPVTSYVDLSAVRIARARLLKPTPWAVKLAESTSGALIVAGEKDGRRFVQIGFDLLESDFPLHVGFPIFVANCIDWLAPSANAGDGLTVRAGEPAQVNVPASLREVTVTDPNGLTRKFRVTQVPFVYDYTDQVGVYKVRGNNFEQEFACNLASSSESNTKPRDVLRIGRTHFGSTARAIYTNREFYHPAILLALSLLMFEWYAYHRRL